MNNCKIEIGDLFVISLQNQRHAYGQYIFWDKKYGPLCRIYDLITSDILELSELPQKLLFPPVFIGFGSVFKSRRWQIIKSFPVDKFSYPKFRHVSYKGDGKYTNWKIYDGCTWAQIGELPTEYRLLEFHCAWSPQSIERRIMTGKTRYDNIY